jgi:hypothetical protein
MFSFVWLQLLITVSAMENIFSLKWPKYYPVAGTGEENPYGKKSLDCSFNNNLINYVLFCILLELKFLRVSCYSFLYSAQIYEF